MWNDDLQCTVTHDDSLAHTGAHRRRENKTVGTTIHPDGLLCLKFSKKAKDVSDEYGYYIELNVITFGAQRLESVLASHRQAVDVPFEIHMICDARFHTKMFNERSVAAAAAAAACDEVSVRTLIIGANKRSGADAFTAKTLTNIRTKFSKNCQLEQEVACAVRTLHFRMFHLCGFLRRSEFNLMAYDVSVSVRVDPTTANGSDNTMPLTVLAACDLPPMFALSTAIVFGRRTDICSLNSKCAHRYSNGRRSLATAICANCLS